MARQQAVRVAMTYKKIKTRLPAHDTLHAQEDEPSARGTTSFHPILTNRVSSSQEGLTVYNAAKAYEASAVPDSVLTLSAVTGGTCRSLAS